MSKSPETSNAPPPQEPKAQWEQPAMRFVGNISELVQGRGKSGSNADSDPNNTRKRGVG
jgi:hypothetical protein